MNRLSKNQFEVHFGGFRNEDSVNTCIAINMPTWAYESIKEEATRRGGTIGELLTDFANFILSGQSD